jgi:hypothetical protein
MKLNTGVKIRSSDSWITQQSISIKNIKDLDLKVNILIPIQITDSFRSLSMALLQQNKVIRIYRFNGSSIAESIASVVEYISQKKVYLNPWSNPDYWVANSLHFYNQSLNLDLIAPFSSFNLIEMHSSVIPTSGDPSSTFTMK